MQAFNVGLFSFFICDLICNTCGFSTLGITKIANNAIPSRRKQNEEFKQENLKSLIRGDKADEGIQPLTPNGLYYTKPESRSYSSSSTDATKFWTDESVDNVVYQRSFAVTKWNVNLEQFNVNKSVEEYRRKKRTSSKDNSDKKKKISKGKQKKVKDLGQLLMKTVSRKIETDSLEDYSMPDGEDDNFSSGLNKERMKWEVYRNEDGSSVSELIALNARHKTRMHRAHPDQSLYR